MRTSVALPDDVGDRMRAVAEAAGVSQSEWLRRAIERALEPAPTNPTPNTETEPSQTTIAALSALEEQLSILEAKHADALAQIAVMKAEAAKDQRHIESLQKTIATVAAARPALPAPGQPGALTRLKWWALGTPPEPPAL